MATPFTIWVKNNAAGVPELFLKDPDAAPPPPAPQRPQARGANLTGGGTAYDTWGASPGPVSGQHYLFVLTTDVDKLIAAGMNAFRVVFAWEAMQPAEYADITTLSGNYKIYRDRLYVLVDYLTKKGCNVLLDVHGDKDATFAAYRGVKVGSSTPSGQKVEDLLENLWWQIATKYKANPLIRYGVTNEPHDIPAAIWFAAAQKVINGIRRAGSLGKIVMPGTDWTGAGTWMTNNAKAWNLTDPANNLAVQVHLYFDANSSGGSDDIVDEDIGVTRLKSVTEWARSRKLEVIIAEIALSANNPIAAKAWFNTLAYMNANKDIIGGFHWWAAGPPAWWGTYRYALLDRNGFFTPHMKLLVGSFA